MFFSLMHPSWQHALADTAELVGQIEDAIDFNQQTTPPKHLVFRALETPIAEIKVLLIGQDPYPTNGVACGLAFAVSAGQRLPQSLKNLMKELASDIPQASHEGDLSRWASQGVLLLNSALTTEIGSPGAHSKIWSEFTKTVVKTLDNHHQGKLVCLSLGEHAKKISKEVVQGEVIQAVHPSPLSASRGFFGSRIYSRTNKALESRSIAPIDWSC